MLRNDQNELLSRVGPGSFMGEAIRRFWIPTATLQDLKEPDGYVIDTYLPAVTKENDYQIDRNMQRTHNYSGIWGLHDQDRSLQETSKSVDASNPGMIDRSLEHLVNSDLPIIILRRRLIKMAEDLRKGIEPLAIQTNKNHPLRAFSNVCGIEDFDGFLNVYGEEAGYKVAS